MTADIASIYENAKLGHARGITLLVSEFIFCAASLLFSAKYLLLLPVSGHVHWPACRVAAALSDISHSWCSCWLLCY